MEAPTIHVHKRTAIGKKALSAIREEGQVPGVLYGPGKENQHVQMERLELEKLYEHAGEATLIDVKVNGDESEKALITEYQVDPLTRDALHVDFHLIDMTKEIEAEIELVFVGVSPAVKEMGGTLVKTRDTIEVNCLPQFLVSEITVDISGLTSFDDIIRVRDLNIPEGITILDEDNISIAKVQAPRSEEEMAALDEEVSEDVAAVEVEGAADEEGEEAGEGESPSGAAEGEGAPKEGQ